MQVCNVTQGWVCTELKTYLFTIYVSDVRLYCISLVFCSFPFLSAFGISRRATISFLMSFRLAIRLFAWNNSASTGRIFMKFYIWGFFENLSKILVSLKSEKNKLYFIWRRMHICDIILVNYLRIKNISEKNLFRKLKHVFCVHPPSALKTVPFMR